MRHSLTNYQTCLYSSHNVVLFFNLVVGFNKLVWQPQQGSVRCNTKFSSTALKKSFGNVLSSTAQLLSVVLYVVSTVSAVRSQQCPPNNGDNGADLHAVATLRFTNSAFHTTGIQLQLITSGRYR